MNLQQLTNERFLSDIRALNKTIEAQAAEIAKLNATVERMADRMATMSSELVKADDEIAKLRGLLERWQKIAPYCYYDDNEITNVKLDEIRTDTTEALK